MTRHAARPFAFCTLAVLAGSAPDAQAPVPIGPRGLDTLALRVDPDDPDHVLASPQAATLLPLVRSTDGGITWTTYGTGLPANGKLIHFANDPTDGDTVVAAVDLDGLYESTDDGATWSKIPSATFNAQWSLRHPDGVTSFLNTYNDLFRSTDSEATWSKVYEESPLSSVLAVAPSDPDVLYAANGSAAIGADSALLRSDDRGATWYETAAPNSYVGHVVVDPTDEDQVIITARATHPLGAVQISFDGGASFADFSQGLTISGFTMPIHLSLDPVVAGRVWTYTFADGLAYRDPGSSSWTPFNDGLPLDGTTWVRDVQRLASGLAIATRNGVWRTLGVGTTWFQTGFDNHVVYDAEIAGPNGTRVVAGELGVFAGASGAFLAPDDGFPSPSAGATAVAVDPDDPTRWLSGAVSQAGAIFRVHTGSGATTTATTFATSSAAGEVASLEFDPHDADHVLASVRFEPWATDTPKLYESTDGGDTWLKVTPLEIFLNDVRDVAFDPHTPDRVLVALEDSPWLGESTDGGASFAFPGAWPVSGLPDQLAFDAVVPGVIYASDTGAGLWRSDDDGVTWTALPLASHALNDIEVHPHQPGTLWTDAANGRVFLSGDFGASWREVFASPTPAWTTGLALDPGDGSLLIGTAGVSSFELPGHAPYLRLGAGTPGTGGFVPRHFASGGLPEVGNGSWSLSADRLLGGTLAALVVGLAQGDVPLAGGTLYVPPAWVLVRLRATGGTAGVGGTGAIDVAVPLPNDATLVGLPVYSQVLVVDPAVPVDETALSAGFRTVLL